MKIFIARTDNWEGFYVDGELKFQHHSIGIDEILVYKLITFPVTIEALEEEFVDESWADPEEGNWDGFPEKLSDVVF